MSRDVASRVGIRLSKSAEGSTELLFFNDGEFIAGEDMEAIFRPFYRSASGDTPGSGLGLYVVKRIVEKYHGRISARIDENGNFEIKIFF